MAQEATAMTQDILLLFSALFLVIVLVLVFLVVLKRATGRKIPNKKERLEDVIF
jgi:flagellar biogenesis protein FliO